MFLPRLYRLVILRPGCLAARIASNERDRQDSNSYRQSGDHIPVYLFSEFNNSSAGSALGGSSRVKAAHMWVGLQQVGNCSFQNSHAMTMHNTDPIHRCPSRRMEGFAHLLDC